MAFNEEEKNYILRMILDVSKPTIMLDSEKLFTIIDSDEATIRTMIKENITQQIKERQDRIDLYNQLIVQEQETIAELQAKVEP